MTLAQQDSYLLNYVTYLLALSPSTEGLYFILSIKKRPTHRVDPYFSAYRIARIEWAKWAFFIPAHFCEEHHNMFALRFA